MTRKALFFIAAFVFAATARPAQAEPTMPPKPASYDVQLRYRIHASLNDRLVQYFALIRYLDSIGFDRVPGPDSEPADARQNRIVGTIAREKVADLFKDAHVKSLLLVPHDYVYPANPDQLVPVHLQLVTGRPLPAQRLLFEQVRDQLKGIGFREGTAYDHRTYTRMIGIMPAGEVGALFNDLRTVPDGWLLPVKPVSELPRPLRDVSPILIAEVVPLPDGILLPSEFPAPRPFRGGEEWLAKVSPELRDLLDKEGKDRPARMEVILAATPRETSKTWQKDITEAMQLGVIEGRMGQLVTIVTPIERASFLAQLPIVSMVRLPRLGTPTAFPLTAPVEPNSAALKASGLERLHAAGFKGRGVRLAIISSNFRGWEELRGKQLPASTRLVDLTAERNTDLFPDPWPDDGQQVGHGTQCAVAAMLASPEADLTLIRVGADAPYQVLMVARAINAGNYRSENLDRRRDQLEAEHHLLTQEWDSLQLKRQILFNSYDADEEGVKKREDHFRQVAKLRQIDKEHVARLGRYLKLTRDIDAFRQLGVVACTLMWRDGHPVDGSSALSRYLDDQAFTRTVWLQPAGDTGGQAWTGFFRDGDGNGFMEFAPAEVKLRAGRWTSELNFLAWQPFDGKQVLELPAKASVRVVVQWREAHDPAFLRAGEDLYLTPLAKVDLFLLRQRDPTGTKVGSDEMEVVARSKGPPVRIWNVPEAGTYEQTLEFTVDQPGRYALRIEGKAPEGIRPPSNLAPSLPAVRRDGEMHARALLEMFDPESSKKGRPVFLDYPTEEGTIGMPSDAHAVVTVGAADRKKARQPYSAGGPPLNMQLLLKPNVLSFDGLELPAGEGGSKAVSGTSLATSYAAGLTACLLGARVPPVAFWRSLPLAREKMLQVPDGWPPAK